jgi:hypothetical protein
MALFALSRHRFEFIRLLIAFHAIGHSGGRGFWWPAL